MKNFLFLLSMPLLLGWLFSCSEESNKGPDVSHIQVNLQMEHAEKVLLKGDNREEVIEYLKRNPEFTVKGLAIDLYQNDMALVDTLLSMSKAPKIDTLQQQCRKIYGDYSQLRKELEQAFQHILYYYPDYRIPKIYTMVTGLGTSLIVGDSTIVIGVDYYLGRHTHYRPVDMYTGEMLPNYFWRRMQPEYIVSHIVRELSNRFNQNSDTDKTLINEMIIAGKMLYFAKHILPQTADSLLIDYTQEELDRCFENNEVLWGHFVQNNLFFDVSRQSKVRYIQEAPFTAAIDEKCPGRIGWWIGWQVVDAYMVRYPEITLQQLMADTDAQKIFQKSKYKPSKYE